MRKSAFLCNAYSSGHVFVFVHASFGVCAVGCAFVSFCDWCILSSLFCGTIRIFPSSIAQYGPWQCSTVLFQKSIMNKGWMRQLWWQKKKERNNTGPPVGRFSRLAGRREKKKVHHSYTLTEHDMTDIWLTSKPLCNPTIYYFSVYIIPVFALQLPRIVSLFCVHVETHTQSLGCEDPSPISLSYSGLFLLIS